MVLLLLVAVPLHAQQSPHKSVLFEQLHNRSLQIGESDASHLSQRMHLLWMAHLVDDSEPAVALMVGQLYGIFLNQPQLSLEYMQRAFENSGYDYYVGTDLLEFATQFGEWNVAEKVAVRLLEERPENSSFLASLGGIYEETEQYERALSAIQRLRGQSDRARNFPSFVLKESQMLKKLGRTEEAEQILLDFMSANPNEPTSVQFLVAHYMDMGDNARANELLEEALERMPDSGDVIALAVAAYSLQGKYSDVAEQIMRAARVEWTEPEQIESLIASAKRLAPSATEMTQHLLPVYKELRVMYPESDQFSILLATDYFVLRDTLQGEQVYREMIDAGSESREPYYHFLQKHVATADTLALQNVLNQGLKHIPEDGLIHYMSAVNVLSAGDSVQFVKQVDTALELVGEEDRMYSSLMLLKAEIEMWDDKWEEAKVYYEKAVKYPHPLAYNNYAYSLAIHGTKEDLDKAEDLARKAVQLSPETASYLDTYAWVLHLKGADVLAKIYMQQAIEHMEEPEALYYEHYAVILTELEEYEKALEAWGKVRELGDEDEQALAEEKMAEVRKKMEETE